MVKAGIHIGPTKQSVENVTKSILAILNAKTGYRVNADVMIKALDVLQQSSSIHGTTITGCNITGIK